MIFFILCEFVEWFYVLISKNFVDITGTVPVPIIERNLKM